MKVERVSKGWERRKGGESEGRRGYPCKEISCIIVGNEITNRLLRKRERREGKERKGRRERRGREGKEGRGKRGRGGRERRERSGEKVIPLVFDTSASSYFRFLFNLNW
jgi:hypothetical protein